MKYFFTNFIFLLTVVCFFCEDLTGQEPVELIGDRPDQTESSITVPNKTLQIETGFLHLRSTDAEVKNYFTEYNGTLLRFGLLKFLELRFGAGYEGNKTEMPVSDNNPAETSDNGFSPLSAGFKLNLLKGENLVPQTALIFEATIPKTGKSKPAKPDPAILLACSNPITQNIDFGYNIGVSADQENNTANGFYSLVVGFGAGERLGFFMEAFGTFLLGSGDEWSADGGLTYLLQNNLQFDLYGGFGLNKAAPDFFIGTGLIYRIPR
jgi:hypothetical protein